MDKITRAIELYESLERGTLRNWTEKDVEKHCRPFDSYIEMIWNETKDFKVYRMREYFYNLIFSYLYISKKHLVSVFNWFNENKIDLSQMTAYDYYNGLGLTTLDLSNYFKKTIVYNDCKDQIEMCKKLFDEYHSAGTYNLIYDTDSNEEKFDVFFSLQEIEHYFSPVDRVKEIIDKSKNADYLVLSHGFTNDRYCGHYTYYNVNNSLIHYTQVFGYVENEIIKSGYVLVHCDDRGKLRIYKKIR